MATAPESSAMETLRIMFPDAAEDALTAVLEMNGGDLSAATNFLLSNDDDIEASAGSQAVTQPASELPQSGAGAGAAEGAGEEEGGGEEDDAADVEDEGAPLEHSPRLTAPFVHATDCHAHEPCHLFSRGP